MVFEFFLYLQIYNSVNNELTIIFKGEVTLKDADFVDDLLVLSTTKEMRVSTFY